MREMRLEAMGVEHIAVLPSCRAGEPMTYCVMFYDGERVLRPDWLGVVERMFDSFQQRPSDVIGNLGVQRTKGRYGRVRSRLVSMLEGQPEADRPDIRIDSEHEFLGEEFMPCRMRVAWSTSVAGIDQGVIAVRADGVVSLSEMVERVAEPLFNSVGVAYAHAFEFPAIFGPDFYLSSVGAVPSGRSTTDNVRYQERLTCWRDNTWRERKRPRDGYLREVYPINFLTYNHLRAPTREGDLEDYLRTVGSFSRCPFSRDLYRWDVAPDDLERVREDLEHSGLILSAPVRT